MVWLIKLRLATQFILASAQYMAVGLEDFHDCESNRDVVFIIVMLMFTFHNRDCVIQLRFVL